MKKVLVLGSDFCTLQVVKEAQRKGFYVIVTDLMKTSPTKQQADESWDISTTDIDLLEQKCKEYCIQAILFGASDFNISNARNLCKRLGLPIYCESDYAWSVARNKSEFKKICKQVGALVAQDYVVSDALTEQELETINFPVVVKPCDKSGNRGMSYCNNKEEFIEAYKYARTITDNKILVEKRLYGKEYNVHYVLANGKARLLYFSSTHHQPNQKENLYSFKCTTSNHLKQYLEETNESVIKVIERAECREGIVWVDCIRDNDGHFYLLEMGYRFGGVMTYVPYEKVIGFNTTNWMVECALGIKHEEKDLPKALDDALTGCAASYHLFALSTSKIADIVGLEQIKKLANVKIDMPKRVGDSIRYHSCFGLIGIYGQSIYELCETLKLINSLLKIKNEQGENAFIYFDDYNSLISEYEKGLREFYIK